MMRKSPHFLNYASLASIVLSLLLDVVDYSAALAQGTPPTAIVSPSGLPARAFVRESERVIRLDTGRPEACFQVEPVDASFDVRHVFMRSMKLLYANPSGVSKILTCGATLDRDTDRNGRAEIRVCFSKADLRRLFADAGSRSTVVVRVNGALEIPGPLNWFEAPVCIEVVGDGSFRIRPTDETGQSQD